MWRIFLLSVRSPELKGVKMARCLNHSWIQIVLILVGAGSMHITDSCPVLLCWRVQHSVVQMGIGEGCHLFFLLPLALGTYFNCKSHAFAVGLLFDEAGFLKVLEKPIIDMANSYRLLR